MSRERKCTTNGITIVFPPEMAKDLREEAKKDFSSNSTIIKKAFAEYMEKRYGKKYN